MLYSVSGNIVYSDANSLAIECGGVAFRCQTTANTLRQTGGVGNSATLYTYMNVREDAIELFGFADKTELDCFKQLIGVSGVGPKAGLAILSQLTPDKLALCIATGDAKSITAAQGIGPKIAQRVVLELKDKLSAGIAAGLSAGSANVSAAVEGSGAQAVEALIMLGYSRMEAGAAVGGLDVNLSTEEMIKRALKALM